MNVAISVILSVFPSVVLLTELKSLRQLFQHQLEFTLAKSKVTCP